MLPPPATRRTSWASRPGTGAGKITALVERLPIAGGSEDGRSGGAAQAGETLGTFACRRLTPEFFSARSARGFTVGGGQRKRGRESCRPVPSAEELTVPGPSAWCVPGETGGLRRPAVIAAGTRLAQHHAVSPLVNYVVDPQPVQAVAAVGAGELDLGSPGNPAGDAHRAAAWLTAAVRPAGALASFVLGSWPR